MQMNRLKPKGNKTVPLNGTDVLHSRVLGLALFRVHGLHEDGLLAARLVAADCIDLCRFVRCLLEFKDSDLRFFRFSGFKKLLSLFIGLLYVRFYAKIVRLSLFRLSQVLHGGFLVWHRCRAECTRICVNSQ